MKYKGKKEDQKGREMEALKCTWAQVRLVKRNLLPNSS